jgi:hypothetical protein
MKKLVFNINPFVLLLIPVLFAVVLGVSYQFEQANHLAVNSSLPSVQQTTSLFSKGVQLVKMVCSVSTEKAW